LEGYDMAVARSMVQGADVWLSTPRRPLEASGTSGMKAAANGVLNLSTLDGWWDEAWHRSKSGFSDGEGDAESSADPIGWAIGRGETYDDPSYQDQVEAEALYELLEHDVIPTFYQRGSDKLPRHWIARMKASIGSLCHYFNTHRMVRQYTERFYLPAATRHEQLAADGMARAKALAAWRTRVQEHWASVCVEMVSTGPLTELRVGDQTKLSAQVHLGLLTPEDVKVELYLGRVNAAGELVQAQVTPMQLAKPNGAQAQAGSYWFEVGAVACCRSGLHGFTIRVLPHHPDLTTPFLPGLIVWASPGVKVSGQTTAWASSGMAH
jgi:starch phosphorylase